MCFLQNIQFKQKDTERSKAKYWVIKNRYSMQKLTNTKLA